MVEKVNSIEELERLKADAATQSNQIPNYNEWAQILRNLELAGVESTGSYAGDVAKLSEVQAAVEDFIKEAQIQNTSQNVVKETEQVQDVTKNDSEQTVKANVANATSSMILSDYMKYYHMIN